MALEWKKLALLQYALNPSGDPTALGLDADGDLQVGDDEAQALLQRVVDAVGEDSGSTLNSLLTVLSQVDFATSAKQLADNHNVTVSNPITGFATAANQATAQAVQDRIIATLGEVSGATVIEVLQSIDTELADQQKDALTDSELRASEVATRPSSGYMSENYESSFADEATITTGWLDFAAVDKYALEVESPTAIPLTVEYATGAGGTGAVSTPVTVTPPLAAYSGSFPPLRRYGKFTITNDTGGTLSDVALNVKASYGSSDRASSFPLGFSPVDVSLAMLTQAVLTGRPEFADPSDPYVDVLTTDNGQLIVANGKRLSQVSGRDHFELNLEFSSQASTSATLKYTVPEGKTLQVTSIESSGANAATDATMFMRLRDGSSGDSKYAFSIDEAQVGLGGVGKAANNYASYPEPTLFEDAIYYEQTSGTFTGDVLIVGYLEPV